MKKIVDEEEEQEIKLDIQYIRCIHEKVNVHKDYKDGCTVYFTIRLFYVL